MTPSLHPSRLQIPGFEDILTVPLRDVAIHRDELVTLLTEQERVILGRLSTEKRKTSFVAGRVLAKQCLHALLSIESDAPEARDIEILRDKDGRPVLTSHRDRLADAVLTISHGGALAVAAAARAVRLGVDVEPVSDRAHRLRSRISSEAERDVLETATRSAVERDVRYTQLFSAKEAMAKCLGGDLFHALNHYRLTAVLKDGLTLIAHDLPENPRYFVRTALYQSHAVSMIKIDTGSESS